MTAALMQLLRDFLTNPNDAGARARLSERREDVADALQGTTDVDALVSALSRAVGRDVDPVQLSMLYGVLADGEDAVDEFAVDESDVDEQASDAYVESAFNDTLMAGLEGSKFVQWERYFGRAPTGGQGAQVSPIGNAAAQPSGEPAGKHSVALAVYGLSAHAVLLAVEAVSLFVGRLMHDKLVSLVGGGVRLDRGGDLARDGVTPTCQHPWPVVPLDAVAGEVAVVANLPPEPTEALATGLTRWVLDLAGVRPLLFQHFRAQGLGDSVVLRPDPASGPSLDRWAEAPSTGGEGSARSSRGGAHTHRIKV